MKLEIKYSKLADTNFIAKDNKPLIPIIDKEQVQLACEMVDRYNLHDELIDELKEIHRFFEVNHGILPVALRPVREAVKEMIKKATSNTQSKEGNDITV